MFHLYNSLTKKKEAFKPQKGRKMVTIYSCGPTVYDYAHIGNLRSFLFSDLLRRWLEFQGFKVRLVMNITDVGHMTQEEGGRDKIEAAAEIQKKSPYQIAEFYTRAFFKDIKMLNVLLAWKYPRASKHIKEMIKLTRKLIKKEYAYVVRGNVYYDLSKFPSYGKLSGNKLEDLIAGARVEINPEKRQPYDFALWISNPNHIMQWQSPWGRGYPGWHIECSAMAMKYLGPTVDIHTGGEDNKFPHHECEIAQSEAATGKPFARFWLHTKHLLVDGQKMSKSLGNIYTLNDLVSRGFSPEAIRHLLIFAHYRETLNFTFESLAAAASALNRLCDFRQNFSECLSSAKIEQKLKNAVQEAREDFLRAMDDDLNTPKALAVLFNFIHKANAAISARKINPRDKKQAMQLLKEIFGVLGFKFKKIQKIKIPENIRKLVDEREEARRAKDWKKADELREKIEKAGFVLQDMAEGTKVQSR